VLGVVHFLFSVGGWSLSILLLLNIGGESEGWAYLWVRMIPCLIILAGFSAAVVLAKRCRRFTVWIVSILSTASVAWFAFDARRHDDQLQTFGEGGCDHYYTTWWWYDDHWDPNR
jgi:hypothetical protein